MACKGGCWTCKACKYEMNWASRAQCFRCKHERSKSAKGQIPSVNLSRPSAWLTEQQVDHFKAMDGAQFAAYKMLDLLTPAQVRHIEKQRCADNADQDADGGQLSEEDLKAEIAQVDKSLQTAQGNYKVHLRAYLADLRAQLHKVTPAPQQHMAIAGPWAAT